MATKFLDYAGFAHFWNKLKAWIASAASNLVHRTGNEAISGRKIFNASQYYDAESGYNILTDRPIIRTLDFARGDAAPSSNKYISLDFVDNTYNVDTPWEGNSRLAGINYIYRTSGERVFACTLLSSQGAGTNLIVGRDASDIAFASAPSTSSQRNNGTDIVTRDWIPNDTRIVHTTGNETINGKKIFNEFVEVHRNYTSFVALNPELTFGQNPSADKTNILRFADSAGNDYGSLQSIYRQNGETLTRIFSASPVGEGIIEVNVPATGAPYAICPSTPDPTSANLDGRTYNKSGNADILTRDWIPRDTRIVHTTGNETISGIKTFLSNIVLQYNNVDFTDRPSDNENRYLVFIDKNSINMCAVQCSIRDDQTVVRFRANTPGDTTTPLKDAPSMGLVSAANESYGYCPTPAASDNSNKIATTAWTRTFAGNTYLPLSGGTMSGVITRNGSFCQSGNASGTLSLFNGTGASDGGGIWMYGKNHSNQGLVRIQAYNGTYRQFDCQSNGTLKWNGQTVQTTSDERLKTPMSDVPDEVLDAWGSVRWGQFQFLDAVEEKGNSARLHVGLIAQAVNRVFTAKNLDGCQYGILCHEVREAEDEIPAVDQWMVRYTEALCMEAAYQRRKNKILENRISELETQVQNMLQILESLKGA